MDVGGGIAVGVLSRDVSAWIPAFAGMTRWVRNEGGCGNELRRRRRMTGQRGIEGFNGTLESRGGASRIGVRDMLS